MAEQDIHIAEAHSSRRFDKGHLPHLYHAAVNHPGGAAPPQQSNYAYQSPDPGTQINGKKDHQRQPGYDDESVCNPKQNILQPAPEIPGQKPYGKTYTDGCCGGSETYGKRNAGGEYQLGEDVLAHVIGAQQVFRAWVLEGLVSHLPGVMCGDIRCQNRDKNHCADDAKARCSRRVLFNGFDELLR